MELKHEKNRRRSRTYLAAAAAALIMLAANWAAIEAEQDFSLRADVTRSRSTVLSVAAKSALAGIGNDVYIYLVSSPRQDIITDALLKNYGAASNAVHYSMISQDALPMVWSGADEGSIIVSDSPASTGRFDLITRERLYPDGSTGEFHGERVITPAINYIAQGTIKRAVFINSEGEQSPCASLIDDLSGLYYAAAFTDAKDSLDPASDTLVVISPRQDVSEDGFKNIGAFLDAGGTAAFFLDGGGLEGEPAPYNFARLLESYGLGIGSGIIVGGDPSSTYRSPANILPGTSAEGVEMGFSAPPPVLCYARPITITDAGEAQAEPLLVTDESCFIKSPAAFGLEKSPENEGGSFTVAALSRKGKSAIALFTSASFITSGEDYLYSGNSGTFLMTLELLAGERPAVWGSPGAGADTRQAPPLIAAAAAALLPVAILAAGIARRRARIKL